MIRILILLKSSMLLLGFLDKFEYYFLIVIVRAKKKKKWTIPKKHFIFLKVPSSFNELKSNIDLRQLKNVILIISSYNVCYRYVKKKNCENLQSSSKLVKIVFKLNIFVRLRWPRKNESRLKVEKYVYRTLAHAHTSRKRPHGNFWGRPNE